MTLPVPTEEMEQRAVVQYCRLRNIPAFHVPNSTWTQSIQIKLRNKALGVSSGVPDLFCVPNKHLVAIEMKRTKGGTVSATQKEWLQVLTEAGIPAKVCRGADEAIALLETFL